MDIKFKIPAGCVRLALIAVFLFSLSCGKIEQADIKGNNSSSHDSGNQISAEDSDALYDSIDSIAARENSSFIVMEGIYTLNQNSNYFRSCSNPDTAYWINDETGKLRGMYEKIYSSKNFYVSVFAKIKGAVVNTEKEKLKENYPRTINVTEVLQLEKKNSGNTCIKYDFWAAGKNPDWSLQISKNENLIEFDDITENKSYYFFYEEPVENEGKITYASHNNIQLYTIKAEITKENCIEGTSGDLYDYSVKAELGGKIYHGCGKRGRD